MIRSLLILLQLLDPREGPIAPIQDYEYLVRRIADLQGTPYLSDADRFPCKEVLDGHLWYWRRIARLAERGEKERLHHAEEYAEIRAHAEMCIDCLEQLIIAKNPVYYVSVRRVALKRVKDVLDPVCWEIGAVP